MLYPQGPFFTLLALLLLPFLTRAQSDSSRIKRIQFSFESGVFVPQSPDIRRVYNTRSIFTYGVQARFGSGKGGFFPWIEFNRYDIRIGRVQASQSSGSRNYPLSDSIRSRYHASRLRFAVGATFPVVLSSRAILFFGAGVSGNVIKEDSIRLNTTAIGMLMSIRFLYPLSQNVSFSSGFHYEHVQARTDYLFRDWSGCSFMMGLSFRFEGK